MARVLRGVFCLVAVAAMAYWGASQLYPLAVRNPSQKIVCFYNRSGFSLKLSHFSSYGESSSAPIFLQVIAEAPFILKEPEREPWGAARAEDGRWFLSLVFRGKGEVFFRWGKPERGEVCFWVESAELPVTRELTVGPAETLTGGAAMLLAFLLLPAWFWLCFRKA